MLTWQLNEFLSSDNLMLQRMLLISLILVVGHAVILMELHALICLIFCLARQHCSYGCQSWPVVWQNQSGNQPLD